MTSLFGGAVTAKLPPDLLDASNVREVPDHQEVFTSTAQSYDFSLIIELLEPVDKPTLSEALVYHIEEAHRVSDIPLSSIEQPLEVFNETLGGREYTERIDIIKNTKRPVSLVFGLFRLPEYKTDVLVTSVINCQPDSNLDMRDLQTQATTVRDIAQTFKIRDPRLFKNE